MEHIKEAFNKVRQDIDFLKRELSYLVNELKENRRLIINLCENIQEIFSQIEQIKLQKELKMTKEAIPAHQQIIPAHNKHFPADNYPFKPLKHQNQQFSIRNIGVPADRQTNQQTDKQTENSIENAANILRSLDILKKEISKKFKRLTDQEWKVFSVIYLFDEEKGCSDYRDIAEKLNLTESSIRDYVARLIKKGISIDKNKINNKNIQLNISPSIKQIASLSTLLALRET